MRSRLSRTGGLGCLMLALLLVGLAPADARKRNDALVEEINARWAGARCRLLFDIPIKKRRDSDGWSKTRWIVPSKGREVRDGNLGALLFISDRDALPGGVLRAGTFLVAEGWAFKKPRSQDGLYLQLRLEGTAVRVRIEFSGSFGKDLDVDDLPDMERWVRLDFFQISAADERLVEVSAPEGRPAGPARPLPDPATAAGISAFGPAEATELQVLGVTTEPLAIPPGREVSLVVTYEVRGVAAGHTVEVVERRVILRGEDALTTLQASVQRGPGIHRSTQSLTVPATLEPGVLELRATLSAPGVEASARTLFQVEER